MKKSMNKTFLAIFVAIFLTASSVYAGLTPIRKVQIVRTNYIEKTHIGKKYSEAYGDKLILVGGNFSETFRTGSSLTMHPKLNGSAFSFHSWIVFQALVGQSLIDSGLNPLAKQIKIWGESMRYLDQASFQVTREIDYATNPENPNWTYGSDRQISIVKFYKLWKKNKLMFYKAVEARFNDLGRAAR